MSALVETMFYCGEVPWHGEGTKLDSPPTSQEAIMAAGLDWEVEARPVYDFEFKPEVLSISDDQIIEGGRFDSTDMEVVPGVQTVRRITDGRFLGAVGPAWKPLQNREAFGWFDPLVEEGLATYHTAGSLKDGEIIWILCQIGNEVPIIGGDTIGQFLLLNFGHNGQVGINYLPTRIRVVCANTNSAAMRKGKDQIVRFNHAGDIVARIDEFRDVVRLFLHDFEQTNEVFRLMAGREVGQSAVGSYLDAVFPARKDDDGKALPHTPQAIKLRENLIQKFEGDLMGYDLIPNDKRKTLWVIYNAITEFIDHERGSDKKRLQNAWFGEGSRIKVRALEAAQAMI